MQVKKNDKVIILTGKDRSLTGDVIAVDRKNGKVKVARRNMMVKHRKPNPITGEAGARIDQENWLDASNVALYSEKKGGAVRTSSRWRGKDGELFTSKREALASFGGEEGVQVKKVRYSSKTEEVFK